MVEYKDFLFLNFIMIEDGNYYIRPLNRNNLDWPFPDKFYSSIGFTVHGFSNHLINVESGLEEVENSLIDELFYCVKEN